MIGGNAEVAGKGQLEAAAIGTPVQNRDRRLVGLQDDFIEVSDRAAPRHAEPLAFAGPLILLLEISPSAERLVAGPRQHARPDIVIDGGDRKSTRLNSSQ